MKKRIATIATATALLGLPQLAYADGPEHEYTQGEPVPDGFVVATRTRYDLLLGGATLLATGYLAPVVANAVCSNRRGSERSCTTGWSVLPIAGPMIDLAVTRRMPDGSKATAIVGSLAQAGGTGLMIAGLLLERKVLVPTGTPVAIVPVIGPFTAGGAVIGTF